jgi:Tol biopolymer transport system component
MAIDSLKAPSGRASSARLAWSCMGLAVLLHAWLLFGRDGLWGGGDLVPHLRLIQAVSTSPGIYNPYAPAYHWLGAALAPVLGFELYTRLFALGAALFLIAGFRSFQRAAGLPDACTALFALTPFLLSLSWCVPRVEAAGYALLLFGLGFQLRGRYFALAAALGACFYVHTAASLLFGLAAGALALARRDLRALVALAEGTLAALPLWIAHLGAGCTFAQALLFAPGGYARSLDEELLPPQWPWLAALANPAALVAAVLGARAVWRRSRPLAWLAAALVALWATNFWLAPFDIRTLVTPLRGLSVLAIPVALSAGVWGAARARREAVLLGLTAIFAVLSLRLVVPHACYVRAISLAEIDGVHVSRCEFLWRAAPQEATAPAASGAAVRLSGAASDGLVFVRRAPQGRELWRARLSDGAERLLLANQGHDELWPFWSPAAGKLLFQSERVGRASALLMLLDPDSGRVAPLVSPRAWRESWGAWSPDGTRVAYVFTSRPGSRATRGVAEVEIASGRRSVLTPDQGRFSFFRPEYGPGGRNLLIQRRGDPADSSSELWLLERGRPLRALPGRFPAFAEKARFSRDAGWVVYTGRASREAPGDVLLVRPDGSESRPIAAETDVDENSAHFSPARDEIAFISDRDGSPDLFLVDLAGGPARNLTRTPGRPERAPRWSPDGERIAVSVLPADTGDEGEAADERVVVVDRGGKVVLDIPGAMPDWMPPWPDSR